MPFSATASPSSRDVAGERPARRRARRRRTRPSPSRRRARRRAAPSSSGSRYGASGTRSRSAASISSVPLLANGWTGPFTAEPATPVPDERQRERRDGVRGSPGAARAGARTSVSGSVDRRAADAVLHVHGEPGHRRPRRPTTSRAARRRRRAAAPSAAARACRRPRAAPAACRRAAATSATFASCASASTSIPLTSMRGSFTARVGDAPRPDRQAIHGQLAAGEMRGGGGAEPHSSS